MVEFFLQLTISGVTIGAVYGLIALGFTLVYNSTTVLNFSQGEFVMVGAVFSSILIMKLQYSLITSLILIVGLAILVGILVERVSIRLLQPRNPSHIILVMATLGMSIIISNVTRLLVGTSQLYTPPIVSGNIHLGGLSVSYQALIILLFLVLTVIGLWFFLNKTMYGIAMKATGIDKYAAELMGVNINTVIIISFALSAGLASIGGLLIAPLMSASAVMGLPLAVKGFIAAVLGGLTNPFAGIVGGILIGVMESLIAGYISSSLMEVIVYLLLPIILLLFPNGILSKSR